MFCNYVIVEAGVTNADGYFHVEPITNSYSFRAVATSGTSPGQVLAGSGTPGGCGTCNTPVVLRVSRWDVIQQIRIKNCLGPVGDPATYFVINYGWADPTNTIEGAGIPYKGS